MLLIITFVLLVIFFIIILEIRKLGITTIRDNRLVLVDTTKEGFFDIILNYKSETPEITIFLNDVLKRAQEISVKPFYVPFLLNPFVVKGKLMFLPGKGTLGKTYNWWESYVNNVPPVEGLSWKIGSINQYYMFLVYLINRLVDKGMAINDAIEIITLHGSKLGVFGFTSKYLTSDTNKKWFYITMPYVEDIDHLSEIYGYIKNSPTDDKFQYVLAWLVLSQED